MILKNHTPAMHSRECAGCFFIHAEKPDHRICRTPLPHRDLSNFSASQRLAELLCLGKGCLGLVLIADTLYDARVLSAEHADHAVVQRLVFHFLIFTFFVPLQAA